jgi:peptidoglycan-associated lipoprotein
MKKIQLLAALIAMSALIACGSKNKKSTDAPAPTGSGSGEKVEAGNEAAPVDTSEDSKPDPASLNDIIYFEFDSSDLSDGARAALEENAKWLKEDPKRTILIEGHTDEQGTAEYNVALGDRRARASKDYLVALGIDEKRIRIITYGEEKPASNEDAKNRRSVFVATKK